MIVRFINRALAALDPLYRIVGGTTRTDKIDLGALTLVHDVSREAERQAGFRCFATISQATGGAGVVVATALSRDDFLAGGAGIGAAVELAQLGLQPAEVDVWVLGEQAAGSSTAALLEVVLGLTVGVGPGSAVPHLLRRFTLEGPVFNGLTFLLDGSVTTFFADLLWGHRQYPMLLPDRPGSGFLATFQDDSAGAITVNAQWDCWVCPKGTFPPSA